jgi:acyl-CoA synthetase (NDP forming)
LGAATLKAVRAAMAYGEFLTQRAAAGAAPVRPAGIDHMAAQRLLQRSGGVLTERSSKQVLACYGFPVSGEALARDADDAVRLAQQIGGSVAMKIDSVDIPHKTEAGAIRLGVSGDAQVREAFAQVVASALAWKPDARIDGVLVQEMVPPGVEMMLGLVTDPVFGPVVVAGLGGIHVEVLHDIAYRVAPIDHRQARAMLDELRGARLLEGVRGMAARDIDAICDLIVRLSWFGHDQAALVAEVDINPMMLFADGEGAKIVDALIVKKGEDGNAGT